MSQSIRGRNPLNSLVRFSTVHHIYPLRYTFSKCLKEARQQGYKFSRYRQKILRFTQKKFHSCPLSCCSISAPSFSQHKHSIPVIFCWFRIDARLSCITSCFASHFVWRRPHTLHTLHPQQPLQPYISDFLYENHSHLGLISYFWPNVKAFIQLFGPFFRRFSLTIRVLYEIIAMQSE